MKVHELIIHPTHCFCEIPQEELQFWVHRRYHDHIPTMELLHATNDPHEKEVISIVAMLDLDDDTMLRLMDQVGMPDYHILECRRQILQTLQLEKAS